MSWGIEMINRVSLAVSLHQMYQDQDGKELAQCSITVHIIDV